MRTEMVELTNLCMIKDGDKYKYPNGESLEDTFVRVKKEIDNIINNNVYPNCAPPAIEVIQLPGSI